MGLEVANVARWYEALPPNHLGKRTSGLAIDGGMDVEVGMKDWNGHL